FDEIKHLLLRGQTYENAHIPTIDIHIMMLRDWILGSGICLLEIPPCPYGYDFITCLTHDVDFLYLRDQGWGRSLVGFIMRALFPRYLRDIQSRIVWSRLYKNWKAVLALPGIYLGIFKDVWFDVDRYLEL